MNSKFSKKEKLKSQKAIESLFIKGESLTVYPLRLVYLETTFKDDVLVKAGVSVPKKKFKKAVDRNRIKRLLREVFRLNKADYFNNITTQYALMILYIGDAKPDFETVNTKMKVALERFISAVSHKK